MDGIGSEKSEFTKEEWWVVMKIACPEMTLSEFNKKWVEFVAQKKWGMLKEAAE